MDVKSMVPGESKAHRLSGDFHDTAGLSWSSPVKPANEVVVADPKRVGPSNMAPVREPWASGTVTKPNCNSKASGTTLNGGVVVNSTLRILSGVKRTADAAGTHANVRLQARAARGASPCKPLFGGMRT